MKISVVILLVVFILIQFFIIDTTNPPINKGMDFLTIKKTPPEIAKLIKASCYDCHSNETVYPWYAKLQPTGWFLKHHIDKGRRELNFSTFPTYEPKRQAHKLDEASEQLEKGEMPMESYAMIHKNAVLTAEQRTTLQNYFKKISSDIRTVNNLPEEQPKK